MPKNIINKLYTHDGHPLTIREDKFINYYIELDNGAEAVKKAGYNNKNPRQYAHTLKTRNYIANEIQHRIEQKQEEEAKSHIATGAEVMEFFTRVMNGEIADQFGLEAPLSERRAAAEALAKRTVDIDNRVKQNDNTLTVNLIRSKKKK